MKAPAPEKPVVRSEIAPATVGLILAAIAGVWLLAQLWLIGLLVVVALVFAGTFNPLVEWMEKRGLSRTLSLLTLFLGSMIVASLLIFLTVPPPVGQLTPILHCRPRPPPQFVSPLGKDA